MILHFLFEHDTCSEKQSNALVALAEKIQKTFKENVVGKATQEGVLVEVAGTIRTSSSGFLTIWFNHTCSPVKRIEANSDLTDFAFASFAPTASSNVPYLRKT